MLHLQGDRGFVWLSHFTAARNYYTAVRLSVECEKGKNRIAVYVNSLSLAAKTVLIESVRRRRGLAGRRVSFQRGETGAGRLGRATSVESTTMLRLIGRGEGASDTNSGQKIGERASAAERKIRSAAAEAAGSSKSMSSSAGQPGEPNE